MGLGLVPHLLVGDDSVESGYQPLRPGDKGRGVVPKFAMALFLPAAVVAAQTGTTAHPDARLHRVGAHRFSSLVPSADFRARESAPG